MAIRSGDYIGGYGMSLPHLDVRVDPLEHLKVCDYGDSDILPGNTQGPSTRSAPSSARSWPAALPIVMGGDHGITWPVATAVADHYGYGKVGIVHFDAHADTAPDMRGTLPGTALRCGG